MNRVLTIQVEITDEEKAAWIWDNHLGKDTGNGVHVQAISEGEIEEDIYDRGDCLCWF
jgi:hypothetical protein